MMTSLCKEYWQVFLAQGLTLGLGTGFLFIPSVAIVAQYFDTKKALAMGIAASGSSLGGVIYPIIFHRLQPQIGFGWTTRVLGFLTLGTFILPLMVMKVRLKPSAKRPLVDWHAFKEPPFVFYCIAVFFGFIGLYTPFYYLPEYSVAKAGTTAEFSIYTISIANAASTFGRIFPNYIADKTGPINMMAPCVLLSALMGYCWIAMKTKGTVIVFALLYGFFTGAFVSLPPTCIITLSPHLGIVGTRMGMVFTCAAFGLLIGTPVSGAILGGGSNYVGIQAFCASLLVASSVFLVITRIAKVGTSLKALA
ncbi:major facilitator superfamily domain-containing protein [Xylogone sp. PMI_703]|nr:major facilitator superfamily domain-containing protein [Xylogone sp. PMI_703]